MEKAYQPNLKTFAINVRSHSIKKNAEQRPPPLYLATTRQARLYVSIAPIGAPQTQPAKEPMHH